MFRIALLRQIRQQAAAARGLPASGTRGDLRDLLGSTSTRARPRHASCPRASTSAPLDRAAREVPGRCAGRVGAGPQRSTPARRPRRPAARPCRRSDAAARWPSRSVGCTRSRAWRPSSRPGPADPTLRRAVQPRSSSAATSRRPSPDERRAARPHRCHGASRRRPRSVGLLLAGHRPNATVATWLAAAASAVPDLARRAASTCPPASRRSSASRSSRRWRRGWSWSPLAGVGRRPTSRTASPACSPTPRSPAALAAAVVAALDLAAAPGPDAGPPAPRTRAGQRERFSIHTMAAALAAIYQDVAP